LLLKGVNAVSSHGGKSQEDREFAMKAFKTGRADVIIATGLPPLLACALLSPSRSAAHAAQPRGTFFYQD